MKNPRSDPESDQDVSVVFSNFTFRKIESLKLSSTLPRSHPSIKKSTPAELFQPGSNKIIEKKEKEKRIHHLSVKI